MDHISRILPGVLEKRGLMPHARAALVVHRARQWIREALPGFDDTVRVVKLQDTTLFIECAHPIAAQECQGKSAMLLAHIQGEYGNVVKNVRIVRNRSKQASA